MINIFINNNLIRCITIIVILLLSVYILVMDLIGCLFFIQNNYLCYSFVIFSFFSFLNVLVSVKLLTISVTKKRDERSVLTHKLIS